MQTKHFLTAMWCPSCFCCILAANCDSLSCSIVGKLLTALLPGLSDRSSAVRKAHAKAIGYLIKVLATLSSVDIVACKHCGTCTQVAKDTSVHKTIEKLKTRYLERDGQLTVVIVVVVLLICFSYGIFMYAVIIFTDSSIKSGLAHTFHAMAIHSPDSAKKLSSEILPLVFLAMHGTAEEDGEHILL